MGNLKMVIDQCFQCGCSIYQSDEHVSKGMLSFHLNCHEVYEGECEFTERRESEHYKAEQRRHKCLLKKLKRTLRAKIYQAIELELDQHQCHDFEIVCRLQVEGQKRRGRDYFGESTAIRHVYDDTSTCSYSGTYGGNVFLRLSNDRYLRIYVTG